MSCEDGHCCLLAARPTGGWCGRSRPTASSRPSGRNATVRTRSVWPASGATSRPVSASQSLSPSLGLMGSGCDHVPVGAIGQRGDHRRMPHRRDAIAARGRVPDPQEVVVAPRSHRPSVRREAHRPDLVPMVGEGVEFDDRLHPPGRHVVVAAEEEALAVTGEGQVLEGPPPGENLLLRPRRELPDGRGNRTAGQSIPAHGEAAAVGRRNAKSTVHATPRVKRHDRAVPARGQLANGDLPPLGHGHERLSRRARTAGDRPGPRRRRRREGPPCRGGGPRPGRGPAARTPRGISPRSRRPADRRRARGPSRPGADPTGRGVAQGHPAIGLADRERPAVGERRDEPEALYEGAEPRRGARPPATEATSLRGGLSGTAPASQETTASRRPPSMNASTRISPANSGCLRDEPATVETSHSVSSISPVGAGSPRPADASRRPSGENASQSAGPEWPGQQRLLLVPTRSRPRGSSRRRSRPRPGCGRRGTPRRGGPARRGGRAVRCSRWRLNRRRDTARAKNCDARGRARNACRPAAPPGLARTGPRRTPGGPAATSPARRRRLANAPRSWASRRCRLDSPAKRLARAVRARDARCGGRARRSTRRSRRPRPPPRSPPVPPSRWSADGGEPISRAALVSAWAGPG